MTRIHTFHAMGCEVAVGLDDGAPPDALERVRELFAERDARFTRFAADSELLRVNRAPGMVLVTPEFARAVSAALGAARQTQGLVDPTLLEALEAAGYDDDFDALADDRRPVRPGARGRWRDVRLKGLLLERPQGLKLDLNGVVKAMAVDDALALIEGAGWVSAGGDVATGRPLDVALPAGASVRLEAGALATSGSAVRRWLRDGRVQHHLIDPRTGAPAESPWEQVTVCGANCRAGDVAAKAAFLLGDSGPAWLDARGMAGRFVRGDGEVITTDVWAQMLGVGTREAICT